MEKEEEILDKYIKGITTGEDNKLRATVGSLNAKVTKGLIETIIQLKSEIANSASNLHTGLSFFTDKLSKTMSDEVSALNHGIAQQVENLIASNERLSKSNEQYAKWMKWLTIGLVATSVAQVIVAFIKS
jgi:hypothetical protein